MKLQYVKHSGILFITEQSTVRQKQWDDLSGSDKIHLSLQILLSVEWRYTERLVRMITVISTL